MGSEQHEPHDYQVKQVVKEEILISTHEDHVETQKIIEVLDKDFHQFESPAE